jgi:hypothetical protein
VAFLSDLMPMDYCHGSQSKQDLLFHKANGEDQPAREQQWRLTMKRIRALGCIALLNQPRTISSLSLSILGWRLGIVRPLLIYSLVYDVRQLFL